MSISKHSYGLGNKQFNNSALLNLNQPSGADFPDYSALPPETLEELKMDSTPQNLTNLNSEIGSARIAVTAALGKFGSANEKKLKRREQQTQLKIQQESKEQK